MKKKADVTRLYKAVFDMNKSLVTTITKEKLIHYRR